MSNSWREFWDGQDLFPDEFFDRGVHAFITGSKPLISFDADDRVLDIGCGPGFLGQQLMGTIAQYHGVDVSPAYIEQCQERFQQSPSHQFTQLGEQYTNLDGLGDARFDKIVCLSVVQYYQQKSDVITLIEQVSRHAAPGAKLIIADIPVDHDLLGDICCLIKSAVRHRLIWKTIRFLVRARFHSYRKLVDDTGLLRYSQEDLQRFQNATEYPTEISALPITFNPNRYHLVIQFP